MRMLVAMALLLVSSGAANAIWLHTKQDDPFKGDTHMAMNVDLLSGFIGGFRCNASNGADDDPGLALVYGTPERLDDAAVAALALGTVPMTLMVIVDDQPKVELQASADTVGDANRLRVYSSDAAVVQVAQAAMKAKRRFAVAVGFMDKTFFSHSFDVSGSTAAISQLVSGCHLTLP
jgi:hypothetical protein